MLSRVEARFVKIIHAVFYFIVWSIQFLIIYPFFCIKVLGKENIPKKGRVILAANHQNFFDGFILAYSSGPLKKISFLIAKRSLKLKFWIFLAKLIGSVVIEDELEDYQRSLKKLNRILSHGGKVGIFPEGTVSNRKIPRKFKGGVAKLSYDSKTHVVPIYLSGTFNLRHFNYWFKRAEILVKIGKPVPLYNYFGLNGNNLDKIADHLREKVIELDDIKSVKNLTTLNTQEIIPEIDSRKLLVKK